MLSAVDPRKTHWSGKHQSQLCLGKTAVTVCFVARLLNISCADENSGGPRKSQSVRFRFFNDVDLERANALVNEKAIPPRRTSLNLEVLKYTDPNLLPSLQPLGKLPSMLEHTALPVANSIHLVMRPLRYVT